MSEPEPADAGERGTTTLDERVLEKLAAAATTEVAHAGGLRRQVAGRGLGARAVRSHAQLTGQIVGLRLEMSVDYPEPVALVTRQVREHVTDRVQRLSGMQVDHVDITVTVLRRQRAPRRRVL